MIMNMNIIIIIYSWILELAQFILVLRLMIISLNPAAIR